MIIHFKCIEGIKYHTRKTLFCYGWHLFMQWPTKILDRRVDFVNRPAFILRFHYKLR
jgi:hypothetical protein